MTRIEVPIRIPASSFFNQRSVFDIREKQETRTKRLDFIYGDTSFVLFRNFHFLFNIQRSVFDT